MDMFSPHRLIARLPADAPQRRVREVLDAGAAGVWRDGAPVRAAFVATVAEAVAAEQSGAAFLVVSGAAPDAAHAICASVSLPVVAAIDGFGGNLDMLAGHGLSGVLAPPTMAAASASDWRRLAGETDRMLAEPLRPRRGALVDMDGTVLDSMDVWGELDREIVARHRIPDAEQVLRHLATVVHLREGTDYLHIVCGVGASSEALAEEFGELLREHYETRIPLLPGVREALERLRQEGVRTALVTATAEDLAEAALRRLGVLGLFGEIRCDVAKRKPEALYAVLDDIGTGVRETVVYDDSDQIRAMAESAGFEVRESLG